mmetsp:Transcript_14996/g.21960  ORF Transcript_14996/g.21960 Transcript_14996/m.21960 type:complete len:252 (-) Transcript_14996:155-910(-)|eukprot:CAMPEP_0197246722 /NCGR_PEP_ID=MMETSP1429-20130617/21006_1 /TAXON_ID=49237 /ORGANISM="Chaetoceros  sp., Strain UNC1202" /LENGTH=251 /DNA_ID=CAMNT_0042707451 /DNA_START=60 /DNA_END=815 /DNA_ORIENTATION=-
MSHLSVLPPLLPRVDAVLILDGDGNRLAGKYYGDFLTTTNSSSSRDAMKSSEASSGDNVKSSVTVEDLRGAFERQLQSKIQGIAARPDAAEVVTVMAKTAVFCGGTAMGATSSGGAGGDIRVVHVGPSTESELLLAYLCEGMYDALSNLMGGQMDRNMVLDNLELVFLLIDEHCDGGIILEVDGHKLASSVLLRDEDEVDAEAGESGVDGTGGVAPSSTGPMRQNGGDITLAQAFRQASQQLMAGLQSDGM